jgi:hypothetical protein
VSTVQKVAVLIVLTGLATTLTLPKRQTPAVVNAFGSLFQGSLATSMGLGIPQGFTPTGS